MPFNHVLLHVKFNYVFYSIRLPDYSWKMKIKTCEIVWEFGRSLRKLYRSKPTEYRYSKGFIGISIGLVTSIGFFYAFVNRLDMSAKLRYILGVGSAVFFCAGGLLSVQLRCTMLLVIPTLFGRVGRGILMAIAFTLVIQGPISNTASNMNELVRVFSCAADIAVNMTLNRLEILLDPAHDIMRTLLVASYYLRGKLTLFKESLRPMITLVEDDEGVDIMQERLRSIPGMANLVDRTRTRIINDQQQGKPSRKFINKLVTYCLQVISVPVRVCHRVDDKIRPYFEETGISYDALTACPDTIGKLCDDLHNLDDTFDDQYDKFIQFSDKIDRMFDVAITFAFESHLEDLNFEGVFYAKDKIEEEIIYRKNLLDFLITTLTRLLALIFLFIFFSASAYQRKYLRDDAFDNYYVNWYFKEIDTRRKILGKMYLLPLNRMEKRELVSASDVKTLPSERRKFRSSFVRMTPQMLVIMGLFLVDHLIYYSLYLIGKHGEIQYQMKGEHRVNLTIVGDSMIANQLRNIFDKNVESEQIQNIQISNQSCLPRPTRLDHRFTVVVILIHLIVFALTRVLAYGLRLRRIFCAFCYYKREKQRTLWLYNKYLKKRKGFLEHRLKFLKKTANRNAIQEKDNFLLLLRLTFPKCFDWLKIFSAGKRTCLICGRREKSEDKLKTDCDPSNGHVYCQYCYSAIGEHCVVCSEEEEEEN